MKTPWLHGSVSPAYKGVYERQLGSITQFSLWDGKRWHVGTDTQESAQARSTISGYQPSNAATMRFKWRGLSTKP